MPSVSEIQAQNNALIKQKQNADASATTASKSKAESAFESLSRDEEFFLKLLTTQLRNQDPTSPLETAEFTQQIAQYTGIEQQVQTNANLEKLIAANNQSQVATAVSYIGREIEYAGQTGQVVGGQGAFSYTLPAGVTNASVTLTDANGNVVFQGQGTKKEGRNILVWDGINSSTGEQQPDGLYTITVKANGADGKEIEAQTNAVGIVSGVETQKDGNNLLNIANTTLAIDKVLVVRPPSRVNLSNNSSEG